MTFLLRCVLPPEKWKCRMNKYQDSKQKSMQQEKVILQNCWYLSIFRLSLISLSNGSIIKSCQQSLNSIKRTTGHLGNQGVGRWSTPGKITQIVPFSTKRSAQKKIHTHNIIQTEMLYFGIYMYIYIDTYGIYIYTYACSNN